jgi:hypothetical protein
MTTVELITALFYEVDEQLHAIPKHPEAHLWPSEVVTLGLLHALKGVGNRPFYRWLTRDYRPLFPRLPERTRLFRLLKTHQDWTQVFLAAPTVLGVIDTYGIELIHPIREGRSPQQIGRKGLSNHRWIVGGKLCLLLNQWGLIVGWACATANVADNTFQWLVRQVEEQMIVLSDTAFHAAEGDPSNLKLCQRGEWEDRMLVETVLSMLTLICHFKKVMHRVWTYFHARLAFTMAAFNILVQWHGFQPTASGFVPLSMAEFSLNWLRVLGTAELAQIDQRVCQQLHPIMPLLDAFKSEQQALELIFPRKGALHAHPQRMDGFIEEAFASALRGLTVAGILFDIGNEARIENALAIVRRIKATIKIEIGPSEIQPDLFGHLF